MPEALADRAFEIRLFGEMSIAYRGNPIENLGGLRAQELLAYLLLYRGRPHPRETLAAVLWSESPTSQSKKYLRQTLWQLQRALRESTNGLEKPLLLVSPDWVQVNAHAGIWLDVAQLEAAADSGCADEPRIEELQATALENAAASYRGDLLAGWYQDWCIYERERLRDVYLKSLETLLEYRDAHDRYDEALALGARILRIDSARESTHERLMELRYRVGDRAGALRQFERCVTALRDELGVKPSSRVLALYERIRADGHRGGDGPSFTAAQLPQRSAGRLPELLRQLKQARRVLVDLQRQVREEIDAVEDVVRRPSPPLRRS